MPTHRRIRPFNTKVTYPEQAIDNDLCQAVVARGTMVFLRGQIGQDLDTSENVGVGDVEAQAERAMANIDMLLKEAGSCLQASVAHMTFRQVMAIDAAGRAALHSGAETLGIWAEVQGEDAACAGNLLANPDVPTAMLQAFRAAGGHLGDRLLVAMQAAVAAGGECGPVHSSGLQLVRDMPWPIADLRVDWTNNCSIQALSALWAVYKPQIDDYVTRALDPRSAPRYEMPHRA